MITRVLILTTRDHVREAQEWGHNFTLFHQVRVACALEGVRGLEYSEYLIFIYKKADPEIINHIRLHYTKPEIFHVTKMARIFSASEMITPREPAPKPLAPPIPHDYGFESWNM